MNGRVGRRMGGENFLVSCNEHAGTMKECQLLYYSFPLRAFVQETRKKGTGGK